MGRQRSRSYAQHRGAGADGANPSVVGRDERGRAPHPDWRIPGWPSGPYGGGFDAWAAQTRVITNRTPGALETVTAGAVPGLSRRPSPRRGTAGPDPVDWIYQSWAYDAHDVGTTPGLRRRHGRGTAIDPGAYAASCSGIGPLQSGRRCDRGRRADPERHAGPPGRKCRTCGCGGHFAADWRKSARRSTNSWCGMPAEPERKREAAARSALLDRLRWQAHFRRSSVCRL